MPAHFLSLGGGCVPPERQGLKDILYDPKQILQASGMSKLHVHFQKEVYRLRLCLGPGPLETITQQKTFPSSKSAGKRRKVSTKVPFLSHLNKLPSRQRGQAFSPTFLMLREGSLKPCLKGYGREGFAKRVTTCPRSKQL